MNKITIRRPSPSSLTPKRTKHAFDYQLHPSLGRSPLYDTAFYFNISALISRIFPFHFRFQKTLISAFLGVICIAMDLVSTRLLPGFGKNVRCAYTTENTDTGLHSTQLC